MPHSSYIIDFRTTPVRYITRLNNHCLYLQQRLQLVSLDFKPYSGHVHDLYRARRESFSDQSLPISPRPRHVETNLQTTPIPHCAIKRANSASLYLEQHIQLVLPLGLRTLLGAPSWLSSRATRTLSGQNLSRSPPSSSRCVTLTSISELYTHVREDLASRFPKTGYQLMRTNRLQNPHERAYPVRSIDIDAAPLHSQHVFDNFVISIIASALQRSCVRLRMIHRAIKH